MKTKYQVFSPDGFTIDCNPFYKTLEQAEQALNEFIERYKVQGYYSTASRERIPLTDIREHCTIAKV